VRLAVAIANSSTFRHIAVTFGGSVPAPSRDPKEKEKEGAGEKRTI